MCISSNNVYVDGNFTTLGDQSTSANRIAKWIPTSSTWTTVGGKSSSSILNGLSSSCSNISINRTNNNIYAIGLSLIDQLFSDYINIYYNGILIRRLYLNGQTIYIYTNNTNGNKICNVVNPTVS